MDDIELKEIHEYLNFIRIFLEANIIYENKYGKRNNNKAMIKQYNIIISIKYNEEVIQRTYIYYPKVMNSEKKIPILNYDQHIFGNHIKELGDELVRMIKEFENFKNVRILFYGVSLTGHVFFNRNNQLILNNKKIREGYIKYIG